jgi:chromosome segregation ATPase
MPRKNKNAVSTAVLDSVLTTVEETVLEEQEQQYVEAVQEAEDITAGVDTFEKLGDNLDCALSHAEKEIARIDERSEIAIQVVTQSIRTQAAVAKGQLLLDIREKYEHIPSFKASIKSFGNRLGVPASTLSNWMAAASAVAKHENVFGKEFLMEQSATILFRLNSLPDKVQTAVLEDSQEEGRLPTAQELADLNKETPVKLLSAQEKLEAAYQKKQAAEADWELVKADPDFTSETEEYNHMKASLANASKSVETFKAQVDQLKADLVGEKAKAESAQKAQEKLNQEIESLKFDDTAAREQRIKRISATLTINIPQIISDLMKFTAEEDLYLDNYKAAIRQQMVQLHAYLGENI